MNYDFYNYANKEWLINNPIPSDKSRWSQFDILNDNNYTKLKNILDNKLLDEDKLKIIYNQLNSKYDNINIINQYFLEIDRINNIMDLFVVTINLSLLFNINNIFQFNIYSSFYDSSTNILFIDTGGLGLPSKDYYFKEDKEKIRNDYKLFIKEYLELFGLNLDYNKIYLLEEKLANETLNTQESRDISIINNLRSFDKILKDYPKIGLLVKHF